MPSYEPPFRFGQHATTADESRPLPPGRKEDWVPRQGYIYPGPSPQAVRVVRRGEQPVTIRLLSSKKYKVGRSPHSHLLFEDQCISRLHGLLYFVPEISGWAYRDPMSMFGTIIRLAGAPEKRYRLEQSTPVAVVAGQVLELGGPHNRLEFLESVPDDVAGTSEIRWQSKAARKLDESVQRAARKSGPVLLFGQSGSGKTYLAQQIHELSERKGGYVEINCGGLPKDANHLQSELVGHVKGAFTGAIDRRVGALFQAHEGTLFLDEVESLPQEAQVFLLDILEGNSPLRPLGSDKLLARPRVRFICSTKAPLDDTNLREDLVNRLVRGHKIIIPTLAERREDIPILVADLLAIFKAETNIDATVNDEAMAFLMAQEWPGHVRQSESCTRGRDRRSSRKAARARCSFLSGVLRDGGIGAPAQTASREVARRACRDGLDSAYGSDRSRSQAPDGHDTRRS